MHLDICNRRKNQTTFFRIKKVNTYRQSSLKASGSTSGIEIGLFVFSGRDPLNMV